MKGWRKNQPSSMLVHLLTVSWCLFSPQLISSLPEVEACAVGLHNSSRLLAFIVASKPAYSPVQQDMEQSDLVLLQHQEDPHFSLGRHQENTSSVEADLSRQIMKQVSLLLPSYSVPDAVVLLPALCLTAHGEFTTSLSVFDHVRDSKCCCF